MTAVHFLVPGPLAARSGGSLYDAHVVRALFGAGWRVRVHELAGRFPLPDDAALAATADALAAAGDAPTVIDGLCLSAVDACGVAPGQRWLALMHHPAALETGVTAADAARLAAAERRALGGCRRVVTTSALTARQMVDDYGVAQGDVTTILPGVAAAPLARPQTVGAARLLCVGAMIPRKGHEVLVAALARVRDLAWRLDCYGALRDGPTVRAVRRLAARNGMARRIHLHGEVGPAVLARAYGAAHGFVLATHYEGYGMAFSEAVARGLPVIGCAGGAAAEAVDGGGWLVPPGDVGGLARALRAVMGDGATRRAWAARSRRARARQHDWDVAGARFAAVLDGLR